MADYAVVDLIEADEEAGAAPAEFGDFTLPGALVVGFQELDQVGQAHQESGKSQKGGGTAPADKGPG